MLLGILLAILIVIVTSMVGFILLQRSEGGALGMSGGGPGAFMTARGTGDLLTRSTQILAGAFFALCLAMNLIIGHNHANRSVVDSENMSSLQSGAPPMPLSGAPGTPFVPLAPSSPAPAPAPLGAPAAPAGLGLGAAPLGGPLASAPIAARPLAAGAAKPAGVQPGAAKPVAGAPAGQATKAASSAKPAAAAKSSTKPAKAQPSLFPSESPPAPNITPAPLDVPPPPAPPPATPGSAGAPIAGQ
jgi:preprotein translocase subunit SecG